MGRLARLEARSARVESGAAGILVLDDDQDLRDGLRQLLESWGHSVEVACAGLDGIERAIEGRPRVALIDIGLPDVDGYEVARRIRAFVAKDETYLVALSAEERAPGVRTVTSESPLGSALLGRRVGDRVTYEAPGGRFTYQVVRCEPFRPS